jgi:Sec-independent protein translocase protein TatA
VSIADVKQALQRIDAKHRLAIAAVDNQRWDAGEVKSQLTRLREGARDLAKHIASLRRAARSVDRQGLDREIEQNEARLGEADQGTVREEVQRTLDSKRRLRELLADAQAREARYLLRLSKIEATIESTRLWLAAQDTELADQRVDAEAIESLNQELQSLDEAIAELRILDRA